MAIGTNAGVTRGDIAVAVATANPTSTVTIMSPIVSRSPHGYRRFCAPLDDSEPPMSSRARPITIMCVTK